MGYKARESDKVTPDRTVRSMYLAPLNLGAIFVSHSDLATLVPYARP